MRILFVGTSELGIPALETLVDQGAHEILVLTKPDQKGGRGGKIISSPVKRAADRLRLPLELPQDINAPSTLEQVKAYAPDVMVVASYWAKLSEPLLEIPRLGGINIHPSLLPRYRGAAPVQHALLNGDPLTGVTIFQITRRMDAGDILGRVEEPVRPFDDCPTLHDRLAVAAAPLLLRVLDGLEKGTIFPEPQDEDLASRAPKLLRNDGSIDWRRSAEAIERKVRAFVPWPGAFTQYRHKTADLRIVILQSRISDEKVPPDRSAPGTIVASDQRILVACGSGLLEILRLQREGKKDMPAEAFLRGTSLVCGSSFSFPA